MTRVTVEPEELQSVSADLLQAASHLQNLSDCAVRAYRSLSWESRLDAGVGNEVTAAAYIAQSLTERAELLAAYCARKGQEFAAADADSTKQVGDAFQGWRPLLSETVNWPLRPIPLRIIPGVAAAGVGTAGIGWWASKWPDLFRNVVGPERPSRFTPGPPHQSGFGERPLTPPRTPLPIKRLMQTDPRWSSLPMYGQSTSDKQDVGRLGCALMSYLMVIQHFHPKVNMDQGLVKNALTSATTEINDMDWGGKASDFAAQYGLQLRRDPGAGPGAAMQTSIANLKEGRPTIIGIQDPQPHWVVVTGYQGPVPAPEPPLASDFLINDPANSFSTLTQYFSKYGTTIDGVVTLSKR